MKTIIFLFIIAAFLQSSFIPVNLVLIMLICRCLVVEEKTNYYLAFFIGLLLGILSPVNLGFWPLLFTIVVKVVHLLRKISLAANLLTIIPISFIILLLISFFEKTLFQASLDFKMIIIETIVAFPIFIFFRFWEERFIIKPELKLRIKS